MKLPHAMKIAVLLAALAALLSSTADASQIRLHACSGGKYSSSSSYQQTIVILSATLSEKASKAPTLFARGTVVTGEVTYALAQCRGDTNSANCSRCIDEGLRYALVGCGLRKEALVADELCTIQLSGTAIIWSPQMNISVAQVDTIAVQSETFEMSINALLAGVASKAASTPRRFATAVEEMDTDGSHYTAYGLAQCIAELTAGECASCLDDLRSTNDITGWSGGRSSTTWCSYQFHLYKFFVSEPMQQIPSVTSNTQRGDRKKKTRRRIILGVSIGLSLAVILIVLALVVLVVLRRRRRSFQKTKTSSEEAKTETRITDEEQGKTETHIKDEEQAKTEGHISDEEQGKTETRSSDEEQGKTETRISDEEMDKTESRITDEEEVLGAPTVEHTAWEACPSAIASFDDLTDRAYGKRIFLFLDYDGTLSKIVDNPLKADMTEEMREAVQDAAQLFPTSIVTGRDVPKAMAFVKLENLHYAGSHGMDIKFAGQEEHYQPLPHVEPRVSEATVRLKEALQGVNGSLVENNKFCVSVHFRNVDKKDWKLVEDIVNNVLTDFSDLRLATGKMVWELRAKEDFTKGDAVKYILHNRLQQLQMHSSRVLAIHIGDDKTDEDAFKMLREEGYGFGILVTREAKPTEADYSVKDPSEVMEFLRKLVRWSLGEDGIVEVH